MAAIVAASLIAVVLVLRVRLPARDAPRACEFWVASERAGGASSLGCHGCVSSTAGSALALALALVPAVAFPHAGVDRARRDQPRGARRSVRTTRRRTSSGRACSRWRASGTRRSRRSSWPPSAAAIRTCSARRARTIYLEAGFPRMAKVELDRVLARKPEQYGLLLRARPRVARDRERRGGGARLRRGDREGAAAVAGAGARCSATRCSVSAGRTTRSVRSTRASRASATSSRSRCRRSSSSSSSGGRIARSRAWTRSRRPDRRIRSGSPGAARSSTPPGAAPTRAPTTRRRSC